MSQFEFIFTLFGLLLGLSIAEVLGGFARAIEARLKPDTAVRIGWLVPLLGVFVLLDLLSFWTAAWVTRDLVSISGLSLMAITCFAGAYYLAARLVFPREPEETPDFDAHFFRMRRIVLGAMFVLLLCQLAFYASQPKLAPLLLHPLSMGLTLVLVALMIAGMFVRGAVASRIVMALLVARYLVVYLL
ncbi:hypothetical protein P1X14_20110 [Sphingomonas sp. AOB5]|uniref:hypothetical protein n=1 Tax=Sphingomonas sp. AOB5 TaxID=3034017 RepID=UPI0023F85AED|nr:hypothetical protein [Sphingomonas sp. AOB5]MDF7777571.1 hypothetical protein [Sphingomonas sp. AOB5]